MTFASFIARFVHTTRNCWSVEKSLLATLRKKTGYTFSNCKKALELHNNDIAQAEKWLKDQAQAMGWSKATKLEGRQTSQGLIAVAVNKNTGAMVELNCETDFVARNQHFQEMIKTAAKACLNFAEHQTQLQSPAILKLALNNEQLKSLKASDGKFLADHVALMIGKVGENASLRRAICFKTDPEILLAGYTHPSSTENPDIKLGKFGALLAYKPMDLNSNTLEIISKKLCQHIVGMNPLKIGSENETPKENPDEETSLIHQDYILDESMKVKDILMETGIEIVDFKRFECGEHEQEEHPLIEKVAAQ